MKFSPVKGRYLTTQYFIRERITRMTRQTLSKQIKLAVEKRLDSYDLLLTGNLADEIVSDVLSILESRKRGKGDTCPQEWMNALYRTCGINPVTATVGTLYQVSECGQVLIKAGAMPDDLWQFSSWWKDHTQQWTVSCKFPKPSQVRDKWGLFLSEKTAKSPEPIPAARANFSQRL